MSAREIYVSETMCYCQMKLKKDYAFSTLEQLLPYSAVHFIDSTPDVQTFQRPYAQTVQKIADLQQKLNTIRMQIEKSDVKIPQQKTSNDSILQLETEFQQTLSELNELKQALQQSQNIKQALEEEVQINNSKMQIQKYQISEAGKSMLQSESSDDLKNLLFSVPKKVLSATLRGLFRSTYGFLEYQTEDFINDKELISAYVAGNESEQKCRRIIQSLGGKVYEGAADNTVEQRLKQTNESISQCQNRINRILIEKAAYIDAWTKTLNTHKMINHAMNMFKQEEQFMTCKCYVPQMNLQLVKLCVESSQGRTMLTGNEFREIPKTEMTEAERQQQPPTLFKHNKYTEVFQAITNSYGTPTYKEINPAFFFLYHFPFTFSIMFGDIGHGIINAVVSLLMIIFEKPLSRVHSDMFELVFFGRYIIFLMSLFSIISGILYNDGFALAFDYYGTRWDIQNLPKHTHDSPVYAFGMDPVWHWCDNSMIFLNSYKMKLSVVVGVLQMIFGMLIQLVDHIQMHHPEKIWTQWIPQFLFLVIFFGYMVFTIIYKFFVNWPGGADRPTDEPTSDDPAPPALINMLIQIFLSPGSVDSANQLYSNIDVQNSVQLVIFFVAIISVLWMSIAPPCYEIHQLKKHPEIDAAKSDIIVQCVINTIEYVLSCISHTASYLRLWALSLAHVQLAEVFFDQLIGMSMDMVKEDDAGSKWISGLSYFLTYGAWFGATIGILCLMEYLSAYLHCLRLAWIEFNSKYFMAEGYDFEGFGLPDVNPIELSAELARDE